MCKATPWGNTRPVIKWWVTGREEALQIVGGKGSRGYPRTPESSQEPQSCCHLPLTAAYPTSGPASRAKDSWGPWQHECPGPRWEVNPGMAQLCQEKEALYWHGSFHPFIEQQPWDTCHDTLPVFNIHLCHFSSFAKQLSLHTAFVRGKLGWTKPLMCRKTRIAIKLHTWAATHTSTSFTILSLPQHSVDLETQIYLPLLGLKVKLLFPLSLKP